MFYYFLFCFVDFILLFFFSSSFSSPPCVFLFFFFKARLFCDEQLSCFVLYLFDFCNKKKRQVFIVQIYLHLVVLGKGQWVIVYPYMLATKWDHVGDETCLSSFLIFSRCGPAGLSRPLTRVTRRENRNLVPGKEKIAMNTSCRSLFAIFYRLLLV